MSKPGVLAFVGLCFSFLAFPTVGSAQNPCTLLPLGNSDAVCISIAGTIGFSAGLGETPVESLLTTLDVPSGLPIGTHATYLLEPNGTLSDIVQVTIEADTATDVGILTLLFTSDPPESSLGACPPPGGPSGPCILETGTLQNVTADLFGPAFANGPVQIFVFSDLERVPAPGTLLTLFAGVALLGVKHLRKSESAKSSG